MLPEIDSPDNAPPVVDREQIKNLLPAGKSYDVLIKGGIAGRLKDKDYGTERQTTLAYVFEMAYRSTIEANDGHRLVERRSFGQVCMAKLLSPREGIALCLGPPGEPVLDQLRFSGPGNGISDAPVDQVARAILDGGCREVLQCRTSRAFVEENLLSRNSVRLTYAAGVGVVSIEPLGPAITTSEAVYLFGQNILAGCYLAPPGNGDNRESWTVDVRHLGWLLDPTVFMFSRSPLVVEPMLAESSEDCVRYAILRPSSLGGREPGAAEGSCGRGTPMGTLDYNPSEGGLKTAVVQWRTFDFEPSTNHLLFERDFLAEPIFTVRYYCTPVE